MSEVTRLKEKMAAIVSQCEACLLRRPNVGEYRDSIRYIKGLAAELEDLQESVLTLEGIYLKCPNPACGATDNLYRNEIMLRSIGVKPLKEGGFDWDNEFRDDVHWETSERSPNEAEFFCRSCDVQFNAPDIAELDGNADEPHSKGRP